MEDKKPPKKQRKKISRATDTAAQFARLISLTKTRPHHTYELRRAGISHPAGRVNDLIRDGYVFDVDRITTVDGDGFSHNNVALYTLVSIPSINP
ncbi:helix-turn-helix domain-containing protein [Rhodoferax fermentans]|uniref:Helix-turn-helix domain-containing protein n=1 Tax=Rhodoferax fermentans TaxID=28066 RepID=A0A1T1ANF6_RHOFE|nr:helix-turn-helix domain-containing protein [Rhodoferax fermentans]MBK1685528.1 hypothetical protein [Rhodoferax fermentans]OOV05652.1 hypothetical protein RF819_02040 [Rhodoferax fermentans]